MIAISNNKSDYNNSLFYSFYAHNSNLSVEKKAAFINKINKNYFDNESVELINVIQKLIEEKKKRCINTISMVNKM